MTDLVPITGFTAGTVKLTDVYPAVDTTDHTQSASGTTKKYNLSDLTTFINAAAVIAPGTSSNSAQGGSGTVGASSDYSFAFGADVINTASAISNSKASFSFAGASITAGASNFALGKGVTITGGVGYNVVFGISNSTNSEGAFISGQGHTNASNYTTIFGFGHTVDGNSTYAVLLGAGHTATNAQDSATLGSNNTLNSTNLIVLGGNIVTNSSFNSCIYLNDSNSTSATCTSSYQFIADFASGYRFFGSSINVLTAGKGLAVKEGSNCKQGKVTLVSGVGVVSNTSVTDNSKIFYNGQDTNVTGFLTITARATGSGFTITSSVNTDSGVVAYEMFEPAA